MTLQWTEVTVKTESESVEAVSFILNDLGASGVKIEDAKDFESLTPGKYGEHGEIIDPNDIPHITSGANVTAYYPQSVFVPEIIPTIRQKVAALSNFGLNPGSGEVIANAVSDENWATAWKKYYHPVRVTRHLTIVPQWEEYKPSDDDEQIISLDPGMAFGTGTHPTTKLMLQALEMVIRGGESMIDVGTGSGVLSIAAKLLGANNVDAYDVDDVAVRSALSNVKLNPSVEPINIAANDLLKGIHKQVDIVVANILAEIIIPLVPQAFDNLKQGGYFLCSGIIADKFDQVAQEIKKHGFVINETLKIKDWYGIIAYKPLPDE
ncbi:ribosomal protein L11 methyltransferase [Paucilactobacillus suebicus DSM 5007 = KCTC 3549]|uniref:Ribosomal protein L11 methyltransferase n=1 Tax=Paucilactobacillus suebicus DSM 5007 = KCTC 3549 TaxID=1423807 RepID=A0A0R1W2K7_9LACO|nr:ribosomal protein L11 methyltransferase [Paucilactobacillus suebicus DSM 5007 = KCTC 3549]